MIKLIRNCSHKNEVATYYYDNGDEKCIYKSSSSRVGIEQLRKEVKGWKWYQSRRYPDSADKLCDIVCDKKNYIKIKIRYLQGCKAKYSDGIQKNAKLIDDIIIHYCNTWGCDGESSAIMHGDLSVDNIIKNEDGIHIIDWEHYSPGGAPFGFDAYNLLFEQLWFSMRGREKPRRSECEIVLRNVRMIKSASIGPSGYYHKPLSSIQNYIRTNSNLWNNQIDRLPTLLFGEKQVSIIDDIIKLSI